MKFFRSVFIILVFFSVVCFAQGEAAIIFLKLPPSPSLNSMGGVGTSLPGADVYSFYYNPAHLANTETMGNLSFQFFPEKVDWMGRLTNNNMHLISTAATLGWTFNNLIPGFPFRLGLGYMNSAMNYGRSWWAVAPDAPEDKDEYSTFGAAIGFDYLLSVQIGLNYKDIKSTLTTTRNPASSLAPNKAYTAKTTAMDYGILVTASSSKLLNNPFDFNYRGNLTASPFLNLSVGYDQRNIGKEVSYGIMQAGSNDPIGRTAVLGYSLSAGIDAELEKNDILNIFRIDWAIEAEDILIKERPESFTGRTFEYQTGIGDIDFGRNLIELKSSNDVAVRKGVRFEVGEMVSISAGSFDGGRYISAQTSGFGLRTKGLFKVFRNTGKIMAFLADHVDIRYFNCSYFAGTELETQMKSVSINLYGIENIF
ncbi:MAG: hypothetical protein ACM3Q2_08495 [Syntrophothermus sp.]